MPSMRERIGGQHEDLAGGTVCSRGCFEPAPVFNANPPPYSRFPKENDTSVAFPKANASTIEPAGLLWRLSVRSLVRDSVGLLMDRYPRPDQGDLTKGWLIESMHAWFLQAVWTRRPLSCRPFPLHEGGLALRELGTNAPAIQAQEFTGNGNPPFLENHLRLKLSKTA